MAKLWVFLALLCLYSATAHAERSWQAVSIPDARCGDGAPYEVWLSRGDPRRIAFEFMGGGACWNFATCFGPTPLTLIHQLPFIFEKDGFVSDDPAKSPAAGATLVYFPYCTGDVHIGNHIARYAGFQVHHWGRHNFEAAVEHIQATGLVNLGEADSFLLYGYSAGAIGALFHVATLDLYLGHARSKIVLADAPGLHFGDTFWKKFSSESLQEFSEGFRRAGLEFDARHGNVAALVPALCAKFPSWRFGVLQGSRDLLMSSVFGDITPEDHEKLVYSANGVYGLTLDPTDNCVVWAPSTMMHTFLVTGASAGMTTSDGETAMDFAFDMVLRLNGHNHR